MRHRHLLEKLFLVSFLVLLVLLGIRSFSWDLSAPKVDWGVSFDLYYTEWLGLDGKETYQALLDDLKVDHLRISVRWDKLEKQEGVFDWSDLDWQINLAKEHNAKVLLAIGRKLPRWPECFEPVWYSQYATPEREGKLLKYIKAVVERYRSYDNIIGWQVENEPLVGWFGVCRPPNKSELKREIALVKSLDNRPVVVTDSGELSSWFDAASVTDVLGTTMYRVVENEVIGYWRWPLPAVYYHFKGKIVTALTPAEKVIVSELQMEPWAELGIANYPLSEQYKSMSLDQFKSNIEYVKRGGFDTVYLWGAEWWYWLKQTKNVPDFWEEARKLWVR